MGGRGSIRTGERGDGYKTIEGLRGFIEVGLGSRETPRRAVDNGERGRCDREARSRTSLFGARKSGCLFTSSLQEEQPRQTRA